MNRDLHCSRRDFLALAGASLASLLAGCGERQPPEHIVPYVHTPAQMVPGRPLSYATCMELAGYAYGILVESHEGRPTKIEGNPMHPSSLGATDAFGQALIRSLVDDDRLRAPRAHGQLSTWAAVDASLAGLAAAGPLAILTPRVTSSTLARLIETLRERAPGSRWYAWEPIADTHSLAGTRALLGRALHPLPRLDRAQVVVSLDDELFTERPGRLAHARAFAERRRPELTTHEALRLYAVESFPGLTGAAADHCLSVRHSAVEPLALALLVAVQGGRQAGETLTAIERGWVSLAADDLRRAGSAALVLPGQRQGPQIHAVAHALNHLLGAVGRTIEYLEPLTRGPTPGFESLAELAAELRAGRVQTLVVLDGVNPAYDAPAELELERLIGAAPRVIYHGLHDSETARLADWVVPATHPLETWFDSVAHDGTPSLGQPLIRPLFGARSSSELISSLLGRPTPARDLVRATWRGRVPEQAAWLRAVHDGSIVDAKPEPVATQLVASALAELSVRARAGSRPVEAEPLELALFPDPSVWDGRFASNPWLQELPKPISALTWGNAAFLSPDTAARLGVVDEQMVRLTIDGRSVDAPALLLPGHPERQVSVHLGYGRRAAGQLGTGLGVNAYALRCAATPWSAVDVQLEPLSGRRPLAIVQHHHRMHGRPLVREVFRGRYRELGAQAFAAADPEPASLHPDRPLRSPAWAMAIDLAACIGCGACVVACQAENNIPFVGPEQVRKGRELHWIRIDSYMIDRDDQPSARAFVPVPCMHCEHAPCEVVCPTGATVHSDSGLNDMVYNRCVGTRYCASNCPYQVRRFNFFGYAGLEPELVTLTRNPEVSVRGLGVMEKCTYCVQRIHAGRRASRREHRQPRDGDVRTACQQVCPTRAIRFGDLADPTSAIAKTRAEPRSYALLAELGTRPRTTYLGRLRNPHPKADT
ncbi:4Fe-4S dicluster domain-containing protein [Enhygromyxa salina]|uniref:Tetrathionate reductase subunit B n=1 Tax=Enhygromyxa salina TaxID=215803 RepID=A0A2S9YP94_9BACT|nr:4Fe-4S dicluster domain-containing protein [Enhygromyxa salina]PRQ06913.1 Tetrathionate reductase subunit B precursor [Enhygromyxa salina]